MISKSESKVASVGRLAMSLMAIAALSAAGGAQTRNELLNGFRSVPQEAQPRVWWHWMNANITKTGIEKDLDWFKRVGVGGFMNFDGAGIGGGVPRVVERPLIYMTPEWKDAFRFAMEKADKLGLETAVAASPGWSETGGPWVKPEDAMKKYVWSETWIQGGRRFAGKLAHPPTATGTFQNQKGGSGFSAATNLPEYYKDTRVFAYRIDAQARRQSDLAPTVTASGLPGQPAPGAEGAPLNAAPLSDGDVTNATYVGDTSLDKPTWVRFEYQQAVTVNGVTIAPNGSFGGWQDVDAGPSMRVEASDDGKAWRPLGESIYNGVQRTITIPETRARFFRVVFLPAAPQSSVPGFGGGRGGAATMPGAIRRATPAGQNPAGAGGFGGGRGGSRQPGIAISELVLRTTPTVNLWEVKANFGQIHDYYAIPTPKEGVAAAVKTSDVIDLTGKLQPDGTLNWDAPAGRWIVVRMGYSLTGHQNGPASAEATGLEVDKLDPKRVAAYMDTYLGMFEGATGKEWIGKRGLQNILNDSYEAGYQNWTDDIVEQFKTRRGYDPATYLPALTGTVVGSSEASDKFLWDWRRTLGEGIAQHYAVIAQKARERGMGTYAEAQEDRRGWFGDDMEMRQYADVPMGASGNLRNFAPGKQGVESYRVDNAGAASVAHIYGRKYVASETFTGAPVGSMPEDLKRMADMLALAGVNRYVIHTSAHQPLDSGPGISLGGIGHFFTRNETWAEQAKPWMEYLGRVSWLLQQGRFVADVAYFYGQEAPITGIWGRTKQTDIPVGYGYDFVNGDVILNQLAVDGNGKLVTKSGMSYSLLYLGERARQMTLPVLRKLQEFVKGGAAVIGPKPTNSPSLADADAEFQRIATQMWGSGAPGIHPYGKGRIFIGGTAVQALEQMGIAADYSPGVGGGDIPIGAIHRRVGDGDIYYVVNQRNSKLDMDVSFRASGKSVELWDPVSGQTVEAGYRAANGRTTVPLSLDPMGSVFVVMLQDGPPARTVTEKTATAVGRMEGVWAVAFQPERGAPPSVTLPFLTSLSEHKDPGVKYFSGTATYSRTIHAPAEWFGSNSEIWLDLGEVHDIARVVVNEQDLGTVWRSPFRVNAGAALKPGENKVTVEVTNSWFNRLVGDQQDGMKQVTFSPSPGVSATMPLLPAGLIGPVNVVQKK